jgi:hypothetical protein
MRFIQNCGRRHGNTSVFPDREFRFSVRNGALRSGLFRLTAVLLVSLCAILGLGTATGQDMETAIDDVPFASAVLVKVLEKCPPFTAQTEVRAAYRDDPKPTSAAGLCAWQAGMFRWDVNIHQVNGPLVPAQALDAVTRLKLTPVVLLVRSDRKTSDFLLTGAKAFLESKLAEITQTRRSRGGEEQVEGSRCVQERLQLRSGKKEATVTVWKLKEKPGTPVQVKIASDGATFEVHFREVRVARQQPNRFEIPAGYARHTAFEDLIQSLMWEKMKSRLGLPARK